MKRKSIFLTIVTVLFASVAWGQTIDWPANYTLPTTTPLVVDADTIFLCATNDSLYPIEFGYDVSARRLSPAYGKWQLISKTSDDVIVADYNMDSTKNGGAGNAYQGVGSGIGGLLFEYTSTNGECEVDPGRKFWVFVFILPDFSKSETKDTLICYKNTTTKLEVNFRSVFAKYDKLYKQAGFTVGWKGIIPNSGTINIKQDSIAKYLFTDTLILTKPSHASSYNCGLRGNFVWSVSVDSVTNLKPIYLGICANDTVGDMGKRNPIDIFTERQGISGHYDLSTINNWTPEEKNRKSKAFKFTFTNCKAGGPTSVTDSLVLIDGPAPGSDWGADTVVVCRTEATPDIFDYYYYDKGDKIIDYPAMRKLGKAKPELKATNSYWYDRGIKGSFPADYGTVDGSPSLRGTKPELSSTGTELRVDSMRSSIGYNYLWRVDPGIWECLVNDSHVPDSGMIIVFIQDPAIAIDYTAQVCPSGYPKGFSLNAYTLLDVIWEGTNIKSPDTVKIKIEYPGTYKYTYQLPAGCGSGGKGVFYLKVTDKIKAPKDKTVKYCLEKLPAFINLNDVYGVAVSSLVWSLNSTSSTTNSTGSSINIINPEKWLKDGKIDVGAYILENGDNEATLVFKTSGAADCGIPNDRTVTLKFTNDIK